MSPGGIAAPLHAVPGFGGLSSLCHSSRCLAVGAPAGAVAASRVRVQVLRRAVRGATCQVSNRGGCRPRFGSGCGAAGGRGHGPRGASASAVRAERSGPFPRGSLRPGAQTWRLPRVRACARGGGSGQQPLHPGVDEGEAAEQVLVHAVDEPAVGGGQPRPLAQELLVEVAAVARRFLGRGWRGRRGERISRRAVSATAVTPAVPWATP